ncbi:MULTISPECIES: DUF507 family protein [Fluviispira]|uniref:DUF507 domain-containing protein n=1 Tax=Fluviispira sanaruensis TaxID=2493639 RepID=A0A4P2VGQ3_FLUSA|nr:MULTISPECIES: DUF507 family protein [Fluviispira]BBH52083.1 hypothetical protein JCM31447_313700 [Fluviispira sanaruensis]
MKLSSEQLERLAERVFKVLKSSGHIELDYDTEERIEEKVIEQISNVLEDDSRTEDRLSREAERLVSAQSQIAKSSGKSFESLVEEVKVRLARSKRVILGDEPERADSLAEKVLKAIWKIDGIDFFSEDMKVQNCIARAIHRFRVEDDRIIEAVEKIVNKKSGEESYNHAWCIAFDKCYNEVRQRIANQKSSDETTTVGG